MAEANTTPTTAGVAKPSVGISIKNLYKIFGPTPDKFIDAVRNGMS